MVVELTLKTILTSPKSARWNINMDKVLKVALTCLSLDPKENSKPQTEKVTGTHRPQY